VKGRVDKKVSGNHVPNSVYFSTCEPHENTERRERVDLMREQKRETEERNRERVAREERK
jgi:hypothetical protein